MHALFAPFFLVCFWLTLFPCVTFAEPVNKTAASSSFEIPIDPFHAEFNSARDSNLTIKGEGSSKLTPFLIETPPRIVLDIETVEKNRKPLKEKIYSTPTDPCIQQIRLGVHPDKYRLVFDLKQRDGKKICQENVSNTSGNFNISFSLAAAPVATPTPIATASFTPAPKSTVATVATAVPTSIATIPTVHSTAAVISSPVAAPTSVITVAPVAPSAIPTAIPTVIPPTATIAATVATIASSTTVAPSSEKPGLSGVEFIHENSGANKIKIALSQRVPFTLNRESDRKFKISIPNAKLLNRGLLLPQFPPSTVGGFTMIRASEAAGGIEIIIATDPGVKISAVNIDQSVVVSAES